MTKSELISNFKKYADISYEQPELVRKLMDEDFLKYVGSTTLTQVFDDIIKEY